MVIFQFYVIYTITEDRKRFKVLTFKYCSSSFNLKVIIVPNILCRKNKFGGEGSAGASNKATLTGRNSFVFMSYAIKLFSPGNVVSPFDQK